MIELINAIPNALNKSLMFNDGVWVIKKLRAFIPEDPFEVLINGKSMGMTKLLSFAKRVSSTSRFPQVLVIYSSGYLLKRSMMLA